MRWWILSRQDEESRVNVLLFGWLCLLIYCLLSSCTLIEGEGSWQGETMNWLHVDWFAHVIEFGCLKASCKIHFIYKKVILTNHISIFVLPTISVDTLVMVIFITQMANLENAIRVPPTWQMHNVHFRYQSSLLCARDAFVSRLLHTTSHRLDSLSTQLNPAKTKRYAGVLWSLVTSVGSGLFLTQVHTGP